MPRIMIAVSMSVLLSACSSTPEQSVQPAPEKTLALSAPAVAKPIPAPVETEAQRLGRIAKLLADKSVYFDYDNFALKPTYQDLLNEDYAALKSAPSLAIRLEGNADERGSREYNLALGQKRAEAVKRGLQLLGLAESRFEAVSYGKERPRAACHEERCWAENRRVDIVAKKPDGRR
jgi:peptidoglycan-associated lipoprotein